MRYRLIKTIGGIKIQRTIDERFPQYVENVRNGKYSWTTDYLYGKCMTEKTARKHLAIITREV